MLTVRLDDRLDRLARKAAAMEGATVSEFMRRAISERAERTLAGSPQERLADTIGVVRGGGGQARESGAAFSALLSERRKQR
jgi:hypothetical protein